MKAQGCTVSSSFRFIAANLRDGLAGLAKSVKKKMKQKSFAANVSREDIVCGAEDLGVELDEHIQFVIDAMASIADELGLTGDTGEQA